MIDISNIKCKCCGESVPKEQAIQIKPRFYVCSKECLKNYNKSDDYYKDKIYCRVLPYYEKVNGQYSKDGVFLKLQQQLEKAIREYKMKPSGIDKTLDYYLNILEKQYDNRYGLGQFLKYYGEAKEFYCQLNRLNKEISALDDDFFDVECNITVHRHNKKFTEIYRENIEDL